jgi:hypothetical protein
MHKDAKTNRAENQIKENKPFVRTIDNLKDNEIAKTEWKRNTSNLPLEYLQSGQIILDGRKTMSQPYPAQVFYL